MKYFLHTSILSSVLSQRLRGVSITKSSFYVAQNGKFSCLDGSMQIPFDQVNDDFCDCKDGCRRYANAKKFPAHWLPCPLVALPRSHRAP